MTTNVTAKLQTSDSISTAPNANAAKSAASAAYTSQAAAINNEYSDKIADQEKANSAAEQKMKEDNDSQYAQASAATADPASNVNSAAQSKLQEAISSAASAQAAADSAAQSDYDASAAVINAKSDSAKSSVSDAQELVNKAQEALSSATEDEAKSAAQQALKKAQGELSTANSNLKKIQGQISDELKTLQVTLREKKKTNQDNYTKAFNSAISKYNNEIIKNSDPSKYLSGLKKELDSKLEDLLKANAKKVQVLKDEQAHKLDELKKTINQELTDRLNYLNTHLPEGFEKQTDGTVTYTDPSTGKPANGEVNINDDWYYFENGKMVTGFKKLPDGRIVYYAENGLTNANDGYTYYFSETNGNMYRGELQLDGHWYYFLPANCRMATGFQKLVDGRIVGLE